MPWKEVKPMDEKVLFIADWLRQICSFTELCARYTISRKTGYKWISRYNEGGVEDLREASRRPHQSPQQIPYAIRKTILELRTRGTMVPGPKKIQVLLQERFQTGERNALRRSHFCILFLALAKKYGVWRDATRRFRF